MASVLVSILRRSLPRGPASNWPAAARELAYSGPPAAPTWYRLPTGYRGRKGAKKSNIWRLGVQAPTHVYRSVAPPSTRTPPTPSVFAALAAGRAVSDPPSIHHYLIFKFSDNLGIDVDSLPGIDFRREGIYRRAPSPPSSAGIRVVRCGSIVRRPDNWRSGSRSSGGEERAGRLYSRGNQGMHVGRPQRVLHALCRLLAGRSCSRIPQADYLHAGDRVRHVAAGCRVALCRANKWGIVVA